MSETPSAELQELARSYGVQLEYRDMSGQIKPASTQSLLAILKALGADLESDADAPASLSRRRLEHWRRGVNPVVVLWEEDGAGSVEVRIPESLGAAQFTCRFHTETLAETLVTHEWKLGAVGATLVEVEGERFLKFRVAMPPSLPAGYHRFSVETRESSFLASSFLIRAPKAAYQPPAAKSKRPWGIFCPLYALHSEMSWGAGDFSDLEALIDWTAHRGGSLVATLPMLASNFDGPSPIISPYSPTSRLFWNEFYLDLGRIIQTSECPEALRLFNSAVAGNRSLPKSSFLHGFRPRLESRELADFVDQLKTSPRVDYGAQMWLKRTILEQEAAHFFESAGSRDESFDRYLTEHPEVRQYAAFQAAGEQHGRNWRLWPSEALADTESPAYRYHLYVQWKTDEQLRTLSEKAKRHGLTWYLDFPVGVDHNSFDVWHDREIFATGASVGCPPDPVFTKGQNWGFPPAHPDRQRESGYAYLIASIRNHLKYANALRIDHVMGLHRLFWIPSGAEAKDGAFVSTPAEEIYAILSVESHRHQAWLVGEDLGTVPPEVDRAMKTHNVRGMYVIQYEIRADEKQPLRAVPESTVASVNTHDMPPFASFWSGADLDDRLELGLLTPASLAGERTTREQQRQALLRFLVRQERLETGRTDAGSVLQAVHEWLAASETSVLLLNLEDLWLETEPQNTPNTYVERPNWQRRLRRSFEQFSVDPSILTMLENIDRIRAENPEKR